MEFSRPLYWSEYPFPSPGDLLNPRIKPKSPALQADSLPAESQGELKNTGVGNLSLLPHTTFKWVKFYSSQEVDKSSSEEASIDLG